MVVSDHVQHNTQDDLPRVLELVGQSGCRYLIEKVLQEHADQQRRVYLATAGGQRYIVKNIPPASFGYYEDMYRGLTGCPHLRLLEDTVPEQSMFVFRYLTDNFLHLVQEDLPIELTKKILKSTLRGLAALHDGDIVHTDIKANNIMVQRRGPDSGMFLEKVQLIDLEDAAIVPPGFNIIGKQVGNEMWRSPEAHASGRVNKPPDIFSFGVVCIYAVTKQVILAVGKEELGKGEVSSSHVLGRQISYFADVDGLEGFFKHLGDSPWRETFQVLIGGFNESNLRKPISRWNGFKHVDADFKDLIAGLANFDSVKRLTAKEALAHRWFRGV